MNTQAPAVVIEIEWWGPRTGGDIIDQTVAALNTADLMDPNTEHVYTSDVIDFTATEHEMSVWLSIRTHNDIHEIADRLRRHGLRVKYASNIPSSIGEV